MGFAVGGSFVWAVLYTEPPANHRPAEQAKNPPSTPTNTANGNQRARNPIAAIPQVPPGDLGSERTSDYSGSGNQPEKGWREKFWTDPNATFAGAVALLTFALVIVGAWQARRLRQTVQATETASAETRRIGEAQVRAYVDVRDADVFLIGFAGSLYRGQPEVLPVIKIVAPNTGQSPAKNFVWHPTLEYTSIGTAANVSRIRRMGGNWREILGVSIAVGQSHADSAMVGEMAIIRFLHEAGNINANSLMVRLRVQFEFDDVFDNRIVGDAFFFGMISRAPQPVPTEFGQTFWLGKLTRMHRPRDWPSDHQ
jgi:hypothetical protein